MPEVAGGHRLSLRTLLEMIDKKFGAKISLGGGFINLWFDQAKMKEIGVTNQDVAAYLRSLTAGDYYGPREKWPTYLAYRPAERLFFNAYASEQVEAFVKANPKRWMANPYAGAGAAASLERDLERLVCDRCQAWATSRTGPTPAETSRASTVPATSTGTARSWRRSARPSRALTPRLASTRGSPVVRAEPDPGFTLGRAMTTMGQDDASAAFNGLCAAAFEPVRAALGEIRRRRRRSGPRSPSTSTSPGRRSVGRPQGRRADARLGPRHHRQPLLHWEGGHRCLRAPPGGGRPARPRRAGRTVLAGVRPGGEGGHPASATC